MRLRSAVAKDASCIPEPIVGLPNLTVCYAWWADPAEPSYNNNTAGLFIVATL